MVHVTAEFCISPLSQYPGSLIPRWLPLLLSPLSYIWLPNPSCLSPLTTCNSSYAGPLLPLFFCFRVCPGLCSRVHFSLNVVVFFYLRRPVSMEILPVFRLHFSRGRWNGNPVACRCLARGKFRGVNKASRGEADKRLTWLFLARSPPPRLRACSGSSCLWTVL